MLQLFLPQPQNHNVNVSRPSEPVTACDLHCCTGIYVHICLFSFHAKTMHVSHNSNGLACSIEHCYDFGLRQRSRYVILSFCFANVFSVCPHLRITLPPWVSESTSMTPNSHRCMPLLHPSHPAPGTSGQSSTWLLYNKNVVCISSCASNPPTWDWPCTDTTQRP